MKKIFILAVMLVTMCCGGVCSAGLLDYPTLAVIPFSLKATVDADLSFDDATIASDAATEELMNTGRFDIVEREQLMAVVQEQELGMTGLVDTRSAAQVGRLLGAKYIAIGSITGLSARTKGAEIVGAGVRNYEVFAHVAMRVVEVETGRVVLAGSGDGKATNSLVKAPFNLIRIGAAHVDGEQVYQALRQAARNAVDGEYGILVKLGEKPRKHR